MSAATAKETSVWLDTGPDQPPYGRLEGEVAADVAVLGGGIVGVTTALMLQESGASVVLVEADRICHGVTGLTTAKVSSQHGMIYSDLRDKFGADGARTYGQANQAALEWIARRVREDDIECDFRRRPSWAYLSPGSLAGQAEDEARAATQAGLPASLDDDVPLPYPVGAAVRFDDQAEFHVRKYLLALLEQFIARGGRVYESSRAVEVDTDEDCLVKTPGGRVKAQRVVVATHYPFLDRALAFAPSPSPALLRDPLPDRWRPASGDVHRRRLAHAIGSLGASGGGGAPAGRRGGPQDRHWR